MFRYIITYLAFLVYLRCYKGKIKKNLNNFAFSEMTALEWSQGMRYKWFIFILRLMR